MFCKRRFKLHVSKRGAQRYYSTHKLPKRIQEALKEPAQQVNIKGWVKTVRKQKQNVFVEVNDGSCIENLQLVLSPESADRLALTTGTCISLSGTTVDSPGHKQLKEIHNPEIVVLGSCDNSYPMQKQGLPMEFLREHAHLRPRTNIISSLLRVRNRATISIHNFFQERGFINVHTPILSANDCEGAGDLFQIQETQHIKQQIQQKQQLEKQSGGVINENDKYFFGTEKVYLTVSGQLQAEIFACSMGRVYTFGPTFRAEHSFTTRHLSEFWMIEPEIAFASLDDVTSLGSDMVRHVINDLYEKCPSDMEFFESKVEKDLPKLLKCVREGDFAKITYTDAVKVLQNAKINITWGEDLSREHEKYLTDQYFLTDAGNPRPVFVTHWPAAIKPFYMRLNDDNLTVANFDLLVPQVGEIIGGSVREERYNLLTQRMTQSGIKLDGFQWYLDLRKYGTAPHAGYGLGFERVLQLATGIKNIRDVIPVPRYPGFCKF